MLAKSDLIFTVNLRTLAPINTRAPPTQTMQCKPIHVTTQFSILSPNFCPQQIYAASLIMHVLLLL